MTWLQHQFLQLVGFVWVRRRIVRAFYTDWDNRFGFYLDDGWVYVYRSFILLARFKFKELHDGTCRIIHYQKSDESKQYDLDNTAIDCAMYSVEYCWDLLYRYWTHAEGKTTLCLQRILLSINKSEGWRQKCEVTLCREFYLTRVLRNQYRVHLWYCRYVQNECRVSCTRQRSLPWRGRTACHPNHQYSPDASSDDR